MDRDGTKSGFDLKLTRAIADAVEVPVIASGGVGIAAGSGRWRDRRPCQRRAGGLDLPLRHLHHSPGQAVSARPWRAVRMDWPATDGQFALSASTTVSPREGRGPSESQDGFRLWPDDIRCGRTRHAMTLDDLEARIAIRAAASPDESYTAKLIARGMEKCAQKLGEEATEAVIAAVTGNRRRTGQGSGRRALSPAGGAARRRCAAGRGDGRARRAHGPVRPRRKGVAQGASTDGQASARCSRPITTSPRRSGAPCAPTSR